MSADKETWGKWTRRQLGVGVVAAPTFFLGSGGESAAAPPAAPSNAAQDDHRASEVKALIHEIETILGVTAKRLATKEETQKIASLIPMLGDDDFNRREKAHKELAAMGILARHALREAMEKNADLELKRHARELYAPLKIKPATPAQAADLQRPLTRLAAFGTEGRDAVAVLAEALDAEDQAKNLAPILNAKLMLIGVLSKIGPAAKEAVPALIQMLKDQKWSVQAAAAGALGEIGPDAEKAVPELINILRREYFIAPFLGIGPVEMMECNVTKWAAARALGKIGSDTQEVRNALYHAVENPDIRQEAKAALSAIEGKSKASGRQR